jgi:hypothetical protein
MLVRQEYISGAFTILRWPANTEYKFLADTIGFCNDRWELNVSGNLMVYSLILSHVLNIFANTLMVDPSAQASLKWSCRALQGVIWRSSSKFQNPASEK